MVTAETILGALKEILVSFHTELCATAKEANISGTWVSLLEYDFQFSVARAIADKFPELLTMSRLQYEGESPYLRRMHTEWRTNSDRRSRFDIALLLGDSADSPTVAMEFKNYRSLSAQDVLSVEDDFEKLCCKENKVENPIFLYTDYDMSKTADKNQQMWAKKFKDLSQKYPGVLIYFLSSKLGVLKYGQGMDCA